MDGNFKKIVLIFICTTLICCNKKEKTSTPVKDSKSIEQELILEGRKLIQQNSSILIDSVSSFDFSFLRPKVKEKKLTIGLIDSIYYKNIGGGSDKNFMSFKLHKADLVNFKSEYKLNLVQRNNQDIINVLYITFSNFKIENNNAVISVKKVMGTSMEEAAYFFEKKNNVWVFRKKQLSGYVG